MATTTAPTAAAAAPAAPSSRSPKLLIAILSVVTLCALGGGGYFYLAANKQHAEAAPVVKPPEKPIFLALEPLTVNLQQGEGRARFLHIGIALKMQDEKAKAQVVEFMPELRSRVLMLLSNRQPDSLLTTDDKSKLAAEILTALNVPVSKDMPPQGVSGVSFNTFVVQ